MWAFEVLVFLCGLSAVLAVAAYLRRKRQLSSPHAASFVKSLPPWWAIGFTRWLVCRIPLWENVIVPPQLAATKIAGSFLFSKALSVAVKLRLADHLHPTSLSLHDLARVCGAHEDRLARIVRALVAVGVFRFTDTGLVANSAVSQVLRADHPASVRDLVLHFTEESYWGAGKLYESVQEGASPPAFQLQTGGVALWEWLEEPGREEQRGVFERAMLGVSSMNNPPLLVDYPWERHAGQTVVDVGGGTGGFLAQLLTTFPSISGVLFDRPPVISDARSQWPSLHPDLLGRVEFRGGNFFEEVPQGDVYFLRHIIHNWSHASATQILRVVRRAMVAGRRAAPAAPSTLLIADALMPSHRPSGILSMLDLQMMAVLDGKERTTPEFSTLLEGAGLRMREVVRTRGGPSVIVAHAADL